MRSTYTDVLDLCSICKPTPIVCSWDQSARILCNTATLQSWWWRTPCPCHLASSCTATTGMSWWEVYDEFRGGNIAKDVTGRLHVRVLFNAYIHKHSSDASKGALPFMLRLTKPGDSIFIVHVVQNLVCKEDNLYQDKVTLNKWNIKERKKRIHFGIRACRRGFSPRPPRPHSKGNIPSVVCIRHIISNNRDRSRARGVVSAGHRTYMAHICKDFFTPPSPLHFTIFFAGLCSCHLLLIAISSS